MDLEALRGFLAVVETGSFVAAASTLRWARATLRRRVDELEAHAGVPLLVRSEQGATPTEAGMLLATRGREILVASSALISSVREAGASNEGSLRIAVPVGLPPALVVHLVATLRAAHPGLQFSMRVSEDPIAELTRDVDVAMAFGDEPDEGPWVARELLRLPERLMATQAYLDAHGTPRTIDDLLAHPLFHFHGPEDGQPRLPLVAGGYVPVSPAMTSTDMHVLRQCAAAGQGIYFGLDGELPDTFEAGPALVHVLPGVVGASRAVNLVLPANLPEVPRIRDVIAQFRALAGSAARSRRASS